MWKNIVEPYRPHMTIWLTHIACWKPKATNTHTHPCTEYAILIAFPLQQWLHERASVLRYSTLTVLFQFTQDFLSFLLLFFQNYFVLVITRFQWLIATEGSRKEFDIIVYRTLFVFLIWFGGSYSQAPPPTPFGSRLIISIEYCMVIHFKGCERNQLPYLEYILGICLEGMKKILQIRMIFLARPRFEWGNCSIQAISHTCVISHRNHL